MEYIRTVDSDATSAPDEHLVYIFVEYFTSPGNQVEDAPTANPGDSESGDDSSTELSSGPYAVVKIGPSKWSKGVCLGPFVLNDADMAERKRLSVKHIINGDLMVQVYEMVDVGQKEKGHIITRFKQTKAQVAYERNPEVAAVKRNLQNRPLKLYIVMAIAMPPVPWTSIAEWSKNYIIGAAYTLTLNRKTETFSDKDKALARGKEMLEEFEKRFEFGPMDWNPTPDSREFPYIIASGGGTAAGTFLPGLVTVTQQQFQ
jgi:hypothetical protein